MTANEIPVNQHEEYATSMFGAAVPKAELHNPKGPLTALARL